ncbi:acyltransferase domain-containing protein [Streptomyces sp. NBC_00287]|uniref:type I polyketide synthase n=1 Tax=Streptomyces sp. NBC_00287 TaxID=2975702 RepID=UPI002E2B54E3|nr:beta-ketoacyl synthase N-terminal-like domain-containing protein [Streptomyces sp. NBC_00287]
MTAGAIAVTGIDCRFPGAEGPGGYWELLMRAGDAVGPVPQERWSARDYPAQAGFLSDPDVFDHEFFALSPREAGSMDPQQRLMLHCAWRAFEDAGIAPQRLAGTPTGVFVGVMGSEWAQLTLTDLPGITAQIGSGNGYCMIANRVSYHLDLKGPSLAVDTACSSSLVAVHLAANSLLSGECDWALAAGVNLALTPALGLFYSRAGLAAPDGRCKPFSADADGIGRGEGVGAVVLRRYEDAVADGQPVYALLRGTAVNQDGRSNGITAPSRWCQEAVVAAAYRRAGVDPSDVTFTEGHGTGTALGDMIETRALGALHAGRTSPMSLGSVKGNLGHTEGAAGIAGLIKVALSLHHRTVPASRYAARENPDLSLTDQGLRLLKAPLRLPRAPVVAGLSSFGLGGTNAHAVLESRPSPRGCGQSGRWGGSRPTESGTPPTRASETHPAPAPTGLGAAIFTLTAPTEASLRRNLRAQADTLTRRRSPLGPICWTSHQVKSGHPHRHAIVATDPTDLANRLRTAAEANTLPPPPTDPPQTAWLFTGQGAQYPGMAARLHQESPLFRHHLSAVDAALLPHTGTSITELLLTADPAIHRTAHAQPALFAIGYALGAALIELGIHPHLLLGHSVGEFAAAVLAKALPLEAAAQLIAARGVLMQNLPDGGGMIAVRSPAEPLRTYVDAESLVGYAALNGPHSTVLSGDLTALHRIAEKVEQQGTRVRQLQVSHAFHSPLMEPVLEPFRRLAEQTGGGVPTTPLYSTLRGKLLDAEPMDAAYWTEHITAPVLFADAAAQLLDERPTHLLELGPKPVLTTLAAELTRHTSTPLHPLPGKNAGARELAETLAALHRAGLNPNWEAVHPPQDRTLTRLTPYAFATDHRFPRPGLPTSPQPPEQAQKEPKHHTTTAATAVREAVAGVGGYRGDDLSEDARLYEDLGLDSVAVVELKTRIEEQLPALGELPVQELLLRLTTLGDLITYVQERTP